MVVSRHCALRALAASPEKSHKSHQRSLFTVCRNSTCKLRDQRSAGCSGNRSSIHYLLDPFPRPINDGRAHVCRIGSRSTLWHILLGRRNYRSRTELRLFRSAHRRFARSPELSWPPGHQSLSVTPLRTGTRREEQAPGYRLEAYANATLG
jgi:hypothetical protein